MIKQIHLLHYLNESTYAQICNKLGFDSSINITKGNSIEYVDSAIKKVNLFNIEYKQFGHIWFMHVDIDYPLLKCIYGSFPHKLYEAYAELLGDDIVASFPEYDELNCDYIEYTDIIKVSNADETIERLRKGRCVPEQLNRELWSKYKKPHGTIEFCLCRQDSTHLALLARCHGTALKKRIKDTAFHRATGVTPSIAVNNTTEKEILTWLMHMYNVNDAAEIKTSPIEMLSILSDDKLAVAGEFVSLAENLNLKPAVRYAPGHKTWKCVYSTSKPKRVLFTIECTAERLSVKACLFHINEYINEFTDIDDNLRARFKMAWNCGRCNPNCRGGVPLTLYGTTEYKCIGGAFSFEDLSLEEWLTVNKLIKKEFEYK